MKNRFDFEEMIMKCWHVTDDLDMLAEIVGDTKMDAKDLDKLLNMIIGMKELYHARFVSTFNVFEDLVRQSYFNTDTVKYDAWNPTL